MTHFRRGRAALLATMLAMAGGLAASGCERGAAPGAGDSAPVYGGTVVIGGSHDLQNMNGLVADEQDTAELLKHALFMTLVRFDSLLAYEPYLAESWEEEGSGFLFRLRRGVHWQDGRMTTAADVAFTFRRVKDPETASPLIDMFERWDTVEVVDSFTVRFTVRPHPDPLYGWTELPIVPAHVLDTVPPAGTRNARFNREPVGNGPFLFVSHRQNDRWVFDANPAFPEALGGRPYVDRVVWRTIPESAAQLAELLTGRLHLAMAPRAPRWEELSDRDGVRVLHAPSNTYAFIGWNAAVPPLDDARVRRALTLAIDRQQILDGLRGGFGSVAAGPVPPGHWAYDPDLAPLPHDPDRARSLLEQAGYPDADGDGMREGPDGRPLAITLKIPAGVDFSRDVAEVARGHLAAVGVRLVTRPLEAATLFADITAAEKRFEGVLLTLAADFRLDLRDTFHSASIGQPFQLSSWSHPEADHLMDELAVAREREEAIPLWHRLQSVLHEEQPWTFLYYAPTLRAVSERLGGVRIDARGTFVSLPRWWLAPDSAPPAGDATPDASTAGTR